MLKITEAFEKILATVAPLDIVEKTLEDTLGLTLAEDVCSNTDSPPFDKSLMDGYAIRTADLVNGAASLRVIEIVTAGRVPGKIVGAGEATQIMTGAPLPAGADAVIKVEDTRREGDLVFIVNVRPTLGANLIRQGTSVRAGDRVLSAGLTLYGARIGVLAELGQAFVRVRPRPRVAILTTGDELVPIKETPGPGQIRNSNGAMLAAQVEAAGGVPIPLGIARDVHEELLSKIQDGLKCDILLLSGGVSAGTLDLVPSALAEAGVKEVFHKVEMKPGKPLWFGARDAPRGSTPFEENQNETLSSPMRKSCYVFGLPGNPVSSLVCCELFVRTAIRRLMGVEPATLQPVPAKLEHDYLARSDRPTYHPAALTQSTDGLTVKLIPWHGSSDLCGIVTANGIAYLSGEARQFRVGDHLETYAW